MGSLQHLKDKLVTDFVEDTVEQQVAPEEEQEEETAEEFEAEEAEESEAEEVESEEESESEDDGEVVPMEFEDFTWQGETFQVPKGTKDKAQKFFNTHYTQKMQRLSEEHKTRMSDVEARLAKAMELEENARKRMAHVQATLDANPDLHDRFKRAEAETTRTDELQELRQWREQLERERRAEQIQRQTDLELMQLAETFKLPDEDYYSQQDIRDRALAIAITEGSELREAYLKSYDYYANKDAEKRSRQKKSAAGIVSSKVKAKKKHNPVSRKAKTPKPMEQAERRTVPGKLNRVRALLEKM